MTAKRVALKVKVSFTIVVDVQQYRDEYGDPNAPLTEVREYVQDAAESAARSELERLVIR